MSDDAYDFYSLLMDRLERPWHTVDIYSISACFGFYSRGLKVFSGVLSAMRRALTNPEPYRTETIRLLVKAEDHLIDGFGIQRFHEHLEPVGMEIRRLERPHRRDDYVQFVLFDDDEVIFTKTQRGYRDEALGLGVNELAPAKVGQDASNDVSRHRRLFDQYWSQSGPFDFPRIPTLPQLELLLTAAFPVEYRPERQEREYEDQLFWLLHGVCDPQLIHRQYTFGTSRIDLVLGTPNIRLLAIEVKLATDDENALNRLVGQVRKYRALVRDVLVVLVGPNISPNKLGSLRREFGNDAHVAVLHLPGRLRA